MISQGGQSAERSAEAAPSRSAALQSELVKRLLAGDACAWRLVAESVRPQLRAAAAIALPAEMHGRADASDIVQQTLAEANGAMRWFHGRSMPELVAWLTAILNNNVNDAVRRHVLAECRSVKKEVRIDDSSSVGEGWNGIGAADQTSPSMAVSRAEDWARLHDAIEILPPRQRDAVRMRHLEGRPLADISQTLACTSQAAAALVARGLRTLGSMLVDEIA